MTSRWCARRRLLRTELISGERIAGHLRVVQSSFAAVITEFVRVAYADMPDIDLVAEVAGAAWPRHLLWQWRIGAATAAPATSARSSRTAVNLVRSGLAPLS